MLHVDGGSYTVDKKHDAHGPHSGSGVSQSEMEADPPRTFAIVRDGALAGREDDEGHEGEDAVTHLPAPAILLLATRRVAHVGRSGRDEANEEDEVDPVEGRVEAHLQKPAMTGR